MKDSENGDPPGDRVPREPHPPVAHAQAVLGRVDAAQARHVAVAGRSEQLQRLTHAAPDDWIESADVPLSRTGEDEVIAALSARPRPPRR